MQKHPIYTVLYNLVNTNFRIIRRIFIEILVTTTPDKMNKFWQSVGVRINEVLLYAGRSADISVTPKLKIFEHCSQITSK